MLTGFASMRLPPIDGVVLGLPGEGRCAPCDCVGSFETPVPCRLDTTQFNGPRSLPLRGQRAPSLTGRFPASTQWRRRGPVGLGTKPLTLTLSQRERGHWSMADACLLSRGSARTHPGAAGEHSSVSLSP